MFNPKYVNFPGIKNPELKSLALHLRELGKNYNTDNSEQIIPLMPKLLSLAKAEKEWYLYFDGLYDLIYRLTWQAQKAGPRKVIQYAEVFYKACSLYLEEALALCPDSDLAITVSFTYSYIFKNYSQFYQIDDQKMDYFWKHYRHIVDQYGGERDYWECRMEYAFMMRDREMAAEAMAGIQKYPMELGCYICHNGALLESAMFFGDSEGVRRETDKILNREIPKQYLHQYNTCHNGTAFSQYYEVLERALRCGQSGIFLEFLPEAAALFKDEPDAGDKEDTLLCYFRACAGDFSSLEADLKVAALDLEKMDVNTTTDAVDYSLSWYVYFILLCRKGVESVSLSAASPLLPPSLPDGSYSCSGLSACFGQEADRLGALMQKSRRAFPYAALKKDYLACAGLDPSS